MRRLIKERSSQPGSLGTPGKADGFDARRRRAWNAERVPQTHSLGGDTNNGRTFVSRTFQLISVNYVTSPFRM